MLFIFRHSLTYSASRVCSAQSLKMNTKEPKLPNPKADFPDSRGQAILCAVIREHLETGEPVGSKTVSAQFSGTFGLSSATVRNVMSDLEETGLVEQPHTSAGRIPTDKGYRFYVDNLLGILPLSAADLAMINAELGIGIGENSVAPEKLPEKTSHLLSAISKNVGIVVLPSFADDRLQHIHFTALSDKRILIVMVSAPHSVHNKIIRLEEIYTQEELDRTARYLNVEFAGKTLKAIRTAILALMHEEKSLFDRLLQTAMILCSESLPNEDESNREIFVDGTSNIISQPDFSSFEKMRELLCTIEEKSRLVKILNECVVRHQKPQNDVQIFIGRENIAPQLQNCALITAPYRTGKSGDVFGTLSVLGPTRIEYARMIAIVGYISKIMEKTLADETHNIGGS